MFETEKNLFTRHNEGKMMKVLMQLSMANPRRIALDTDTSDTQNTDVSSSISNPFRKKSTKSKAF
jgi:hypothetical protein